MLEKITSAIFVLSPGRCGTQWLAGTLSNLPGDHRVKHEPLHLYYTPLHNSPVSPLNHNQEILTKHLTNISELLAEGITYIETGFPCWRHLQWFKEQLSQPVKVIYIHRDPLQNAKSLLKLNAFVPPVLPHIPEKTLFLPTAPDAQLSDYQSRWNTLTPFEKNLYYWAEVQLQAQQYKNNWRPEDWLTLSFESVFTPASLNSIRQFCGIPAPQDESPLENVDNFRGVPQSIASDDDLSNHPQIATIARELGYDY